MHRVGVDWLHCDHAHDRGQHTERPRDHQRPFRRGQMHVGQHVVLGVVVEFVHVDALYIYQEEARPCAESEYRQGDTSRPARTMCAIAAELSEDDIDALAAAYAELPYVKAKQEFDAAKAAAGKALHDEHCDKCHSDEGTNPEDEAGMLGGQMMGYLRTTFEQYGDGSREQPGKMKEKLDALSADEIEALVHYYGSIQ